jgi:hypothetical protein
VWVQLPEAVRERVDELVRAGSTIHAVMAIRGSGLLPQPSLPDCQELLAWHRHQLGVPAHRPAPSAEEMIEQASGLPWTPDAIEAIWDGDTDGWFVVLTAVCTSQRAEAALGIIRHGSDIRLFQGKVPPWPESQEASILGRILAEHFNVPFHFASPDVPDDQALRL